MTTPAAPAKDSRRSVKVERTGKPGYNQRLLAPSPSHPGMAGFLIFIVIPLIASLVISLYHWPLYGEHKFVGIQNVSTISGADPVFFTVLRNTAVFAIGYTIANLIICTGIARVALHSLPDWAPFFRVLFFIPVVTPMVAQRTGLAAHAAGQRPRQHQPPAGSASKGPPGWATAQLGAHFAHRNVALAGHRLQHRRVGRRPEQHQPVRHGGSPDRRHQH